MDYSPNQDNEQPIENLSFTDAMPILIQSLESASNRIFIKLIDINHNLIAQTEFIDTLKNKCIQDRNFRCEILCEKLRPNSRISDFIRYYQRLTDKISIKRYVPPPVDSDRRQFMIIDSKLVAWQSNIRFTDLKIIKSSYRVKNYQGEFNSLFSNSHSDLSLVRLYL